MNDYHVRLSYTITTIQMRLTPTRFDYNHQIRQTHREVNPRSQAQETNEHSGVAIGGSRFSMNLGP